MDDSELLQQYLDAGSAGAFAQLMSRHINMVYAAARRQVTDPHLADDITQAVFLLLSQKAHKVHGGAGLPGWLLITTHYVARHARKLESRRRAHEQRAASMAEPRVQRNKETSWQEVYPELDAALARLSEKDRSIVALHFMEGRTFREVGSTLGMSEDAARLASARAVQKLRQNLSRTGMSVSALALGTMIATHGLMKAPATLANTITATTILGFGQTSATVLDLAQKAAVSMKVKAVLMTNAVIAGILLTGAAATLAFMHVVGSGHSIDNTALASVSVPSNATPLVASFDSGGSIELLGVAKYPAENTSWWTGRQWWEPTGTPLSHALGSPVLPTPVDPNHEHRQLYQFAFKLHDRDVNPQDLSLIAMGEADGTQGTYLQTSNVEKNGILYATALLYPEQTATNVVVRLATDPYEHVTLDAQGRSINPVEPYTRGFFPTRVGTTSGYTYLSPRSEPYNNFDFHITAQGADGTTFFPAAHAPRYMGQEGDQSATPIICFALPRSSIHQYQVDLRRCKDFVTFRHVSLRSGLASAASSENKYQFWEPKLIDADKPLRDLYANVIGSIKRGKSAEAYALCQKLSDEMRAREFSVRGTPNEYQFLEGQPILAQLEQSLSQSDLSTAMTLIDSGNGNGHRICHMVNTFSGLPKADPGPQ